MIEQEHQDLVAAYNEGVPLQALLTSYNDNNHNSMTFDEGWAVVKARFNTLQKFRGGLETAFPGTSLVESDFYMLKAEKDVLGQGCDRFITGRGPPGKAI